jgi:hypothetical protein
VRRSARNPSRPLGASTRQASDGFRKISAVCRPQSLGRILGPYSMATTPPRTRTFRGAERSSRRGGRQLTSHVTLFPLSAGCPGPGRCASRRTGHTNSRCLPGRCRQPSTIDPSTGSTRRLGCAGAARWWSGWSVWSSRCGRGPRLGVLPAGQWHRWEQPHALHPPLTRLVNAGCPIVCQARVLAAGSMVNSRCRHHLLRRATRRGIG